jgi:hypothetical protein
MPAKPKSTKETDAQQPADEGLSRIDLLSVLVRQRGDVKFCFDDEDGWFVQTLYSRSMPDSWMTLDMHIDRHDSPDAALRGAVTAHNEEVHRLRCQGRYCFMDIIPDNGKHVHPLPAWAEDELGANGHNTTDAANTAAGSGLHDAT